LLVTPVWGFKREKCALVYGNGTIGCAQLCLAASIVVLISAVANAQPPQPHADPWDGMAKKSAWVIVGALDVATGQWATVHSLAPGPGLTFDPDQLPAVGQTVVVTSEQELIIPDFRFTGEERLTDPPVDTRWARHRTGRTLRPGMRVIVYDVWKNPRVSNLQTVWARVGPPQP
jgi:hypothetical protein